MKSSRSGSTRSASSLFPRSGVHREKQVGEATEGYAPPYVPMESDITEYSDVEYYMLTQLSEEDLLDLLGGGG